MNHQAGPLSETSRRWLLDWARSSIAAALAGRQSPRPDSLPAECEAPGGCFVTLHDGPAQGGGLRGCIGTFASDQPLWQTAREMAIAAATRDPRFAPLPAEALPQVQLEISVLSPLQTIKPEQVVVGRHGLCVERGPYRGVLLPQVATENNWNAETFLAQTCRKARLPPEAWRDSQTHLQAFTAEVFSEPPPGSADEHSRPDPIRQAGE